jgi:hypothetical protein
MIESKLDLACARLMESADYGRTVFRANRSRPHIVPCSAHLRCNRGLISRRPPTSTVLVDKFVGNDAPPLGKARRFDRRVALPHN